jgi:haloacetate dehalogenase
MTGMSVVELRRDTEPASLIPAFETVDVQLPSGVRIHGAVGGDGPPLLLLHGHPQTHATWRDIAPALAREHTVIATDLRGYGDSSKPASDPKHRAYSKRATAADQVAVMAAFGHDSFDLVGHDRGARVAHRMAVDHPDVVRRLAVLDIAPTATMYARTDKAFATAYFWWFFFIQPAPLPETLIAGSIEEFLRDHLSGQSKTPGVPSAELAAEYLRCYRIPGAVHAMCEDYRAAAGIDLEFDEQDRLAGRRLTQPLLALWGALGTVGKTYDVLATWREVSDATVSGAGLPSGHLLQEECPDEVIAQLSAFLR